MFSHDQHEPDRYRHTTQVKITSPTDILDVVPALLGFYPVESLCALYLDDTPAGRILAVTARTDLPTTPDDTASLLAHVAVMLERYPAAILVAYATDLEQGRHTIAQTAAAFGPDRIVTGIVAAPQGWTTVDPLHPTAVQWTNPYPAGTGNAAAEVAAAGFYAYGTRDDLADTIATPDPHTAADYHWATAEQNLPDQPTAAQAEQMAAEVREFVANYGAQPTTVTVEDAAFLTRRIRFNAPRDAAVREVTRTDALVHMTLWQGVAAMTPDPDAAQVLGVVAVVAWVAGNGALANLALERAHTAGHHTGRGLLGIARHAIEQAIPPAIWDDIIDTL